MPYETLITPAELSAHLDDKRWRIIDCRFSLANSAAGREEYRQGHIPGALYAHLDEDLSSPITLTSGRHPLPQREKLAARLGAWGIDATTQVVVYDNSNGTIAARLWWLLRWLGHDAVALLDGGVARWLREGYPLSADVAAAAPCHFPIRPPLEETISSRALSEALAQQHELLIDVRAAERFRGEVEPLDKVAGHIPGAVNLPLQHNLDSEGNFRTPEQLHDIYRPLLTGRSEEQVSVMCGSGVTACHTLLAMRVAGVCHAKLYAGSWSEWITDAQRPVASGA